MNHSRDEVVLLLEGEADIANAPLLERVLIRTINLVGDVVVDMEGLTFIDSAGTRALTRAAVHAGTFGARVVVRNPPPIACRIFDILDLGALLTVEVRQPPAVCL
jgi:anti-sigma B factor antagonist/stage II sporulation protein AA (anti-sigma F factor antagonist)